MSKKLLRFLPVIFLIVPLLMQAQESSTLKWQKPIDATATWDVDQAGNVYLFNQQSISKLDTGGRQLLTQSTKSLGDITKIDAGNWLKVAIFSEGQQQICYLDNALAIQPGCIDLSELNIELASEFSTSVQTDRIWVFDQPNSELKLITLRTNQQQVVQNLKALVDLGTITQLLEFQNTLFLADDRNQVVRFDNFGSFIGSQKLPFAQVEEFEGPTTGGVFPVSFVQPFENGLLYSRGTGIFSLAALSDQERLLFQLDLITGPVRKFVLAGKHLYVSTGTTFYCFEIKSGQ